MKTSLINVVVILFLQHAGAQNVGIGTQTPATRLEVTHNGASTFGTVLLINQNAIGNSDGPKIQFTKTMNSPKSWTAGILNGTDVGTFVISEDGGTGGFGAPRLSITAGGNVGLNNTLPSFPLTFNGAIGDKISLWTDGTATHYGFGIQAGLFQVFTKTYFDDVAFGYGNSSSFTETMRIKGNGNVGIGTTTPDFLLDVSNRIRIRSGGDLNNTAGLWLNKTDNTAVQAFIGIEDDSHVGIYGGVAGWKFGMNTQTGALKINGSEGTFGQVLRSNGSGQPASWSPSLYSNINEYGEVGTISIGPLGNAKIPGLDNIPISLSPRSKIIMSASLNVLSNSCFGCGGSSITMDLTFIQFANGGRAQSNIGSGETKTMVVPSKFFTLEAGNYNIYLTVRNENLSGPSVTCSQGRVNIIIVPE